ncbi:hypothetical protein AB0L80_03040 [Streptomyces sp. NPDC052069]|uniref:hypothetical protein n=1 Tax=Streptomyces sp. NPDC052069 TaxID=3154650 RepID=UPI0034267769
MRTPPHTPLIEARIEHGFRLDVLRYGPETGFAPEPVDLRILTGLREVIRVIRVQLRAGRTLGPIPRETARALHRGGGAPRTPGTRPAG